MTPPDLLELCRRGPVHFMGIAGAGMTPLAELLLGAGGRVTGCDAHPGPGIGRLEAVGASIAVGHDPAHIEGCVALVVTAAVPPDHPEIRAARGL
ncbi:MAG: Mur ligase domain-containing protein, partial [Gemmatimonadota bacterium]|nr:Mur ligase domain-containing protein [Gemmatimonadota bacterium]